MFEDEHHKREELVLGAAWCMRHNLHVTDPVTAFAVNCLKHIVLLLGRSASALAGGGPGSLGCLFSTKLLLDTECLLRIP